MPLAASRLLLLLSLLIAYALAQESDIQIYKRTGLAGGDLGPHPANVRQVISPFSFQQDGNQLRIELDAQSGNTIITDLFVGQQMDGGKPYEMAPGTIQRIRFGGAKGTLIQASHSVWSDWTSLRYDHTKTYIVSIGHTGNANFTWNGNGRAWILWDAQQIAGSAATPDYVYSEGLTAVLKTVQLQESPAIISEVPRRQPHILEPPDGTVLHGAGQDPTAFATYSSLIPDSPPVLYMAYIGLDENLDLAFSSLDRELRRYPAALIPQIGLPFMKAGGSAPLDSEIVAGHYDAQVEAYCEHLRHLRRPAFLRVGYEFNGEWNGYSSSTYRSAYIRIVKALRRHRLSNVASVWDYAPAGSMKDYMSFYPGDCYVDWWGINLFSVNTFLSIDALAFLQDAQDRGFPVMIGESTPQGVGVRGGDTSWRTWYVPYFRYMESFPVIKAFCYINWDWAAYPQWSTWGDAELQNNDLVLANYRAELRKHKYISTRIAHTLRGWLPANVNHSSVNRACQ